MPQEVIFEGFRVVLPLTPEASLRLKLLWNGAKTLEALLPRAVWILPPKELGAIEAALKVITLDLEGIITASDAAAEHLSKTRPS